MSKAKPFGISKRLVWDAYKRVKANRGAAGVDGQSIAEFEKGLGNNLYKLWNRMSSGSYFPPPVRRVEIPKGDGKTRPLGIPTVADRVAQTVVKMILEPDLEGAFHPDSYGYRPGKSAIDAVDMARRRCWRYDWVLDLDIKGFFDNIDHDLMMRAVRKHTDCVWALLYIERWLKAPVQTAAGDLVAPGKGTPQGGVISPLLANLFLHYAFDVWMQWNHSYIPFERYADDVICHCTSERQARWLHKTLQARFFECGLELHPDKTKIVYCKDDDRRGRAANEKFDFLGFTFRPRSARNREGKLFIGFLPAAGDKSVRRMRSTIRSWRLGRRSDLSLVDISRWINPIIRGWLTYYGSYYGSALHPVFNQLNRTLAKWAMRKYKRLRRKRRRATHWLGRVARRWKNLFAHWRMMPSTQPAAGR